jgi:hypothetical protein
MSADRQPGDRHGPEDHELQVLRPRGGVLE